LCTFAWVVGINATLTLFLNPEPPKGYGFTGFQISFFYFTPIVAVILGEVFGHYFNDWVANRYIAKHKGVFDPEARLVTTCIAEIFIIPGLVIIGFTLERHWHWALLSIGWGLYMFGIMVFTTAITAYVLDCYPDSAGEVSSWVNMGRTTGGFVISYVQILWATRSGTELSFGVQAAICATVFLVFVPLLHWKGRAMREWAGPIDKEGQETHGRSPNTSNRRSIRASSLSAASKSLERDEFEEEKAAGDERIENRKQ